VLAGAAASSPELRAESTDAEVGVRTVNPDAEGGTVAVSQPFSTNMRLAPRKSKVLGPAG